MPEQIPDQGRVEPTPSVEAQILVGDWQTSPELDQGRLIQIRGLSSDPPTSGRQLLEGLPISNLTKAGLAQPAWGREPKEAWRVEGTLVRIQAKRAPDDTAAGEVDVTFQGNSSGQTVAEAVRPEIGTASCLVFQPPRSNKVIVVIVSTSAESPPRSGYATVYRTDLFELRSQDRTWTAKPGSAPFQTFHHVEVTIPQKGHGGDLRLVAEEVDYSRDKRTLVAKDGALFDAAGRTLIKAPWFEVVFEDGKVEYREVE